MKLRALPPSGVPIGLLDIAVGLKAMFTGGRGVEDFNQEVCRVFGVRHAVTVSSGRAGLSLLFRALQRLNPGHNEVLIPAFTSFSIPSAAVNADLQVALYDLDPGTLSPVMESLESAITDNTLCIVVCHLFGFPVDLDAVLAVARKRQIPVIDDAAQAMGARYRGRQVGTFGSAGLFSLSRGKNITAVDGGVVVTNDDRLARELETIEVAPVAVRDHLALLLKALLLSVLLHPCIYWLPRALPWLNLGASFFEPRFAIKRFTAFQAGIARRMLRRLEEINAARRRQAAIWTALCAVNRDLVQPRVFSGSEPVFLRFPVLATRPLEWPEMGLVRSYPQPLQLLRGLEPFLATKLDFPGASELAERMVTFPTHCFVTDDDCRHVVAAVS